ncbi:MAG: flavodoxin FldA [Paludibacteraceae bacterium]|nr:flavodoxin FldA [Paludibacteraceae bacterium]
MKIGIFYGSSTGVTEDIANRIAEKLKVDASDVHNVYNADKSMIEAYDVLLLGSSTWGCGDLQDDWYDGVKKFKEANLSGKKIAFFGLGDSCSFSGTFCDAMGLIKQDLQGSGAEFIGETSVDGYSFDASVSVEGDKFVGLPLDEVNESFKTDERIANWVSSLNL